MSGPRIVLVSRELYPLSGGGIGQFVTSAAGVLTGAAEVTVLTSSSLEASFRELRAAGDARLPPGSVRVEFVPEPSFDELGGWTHLMHAYSANVYERLGELFGERGPDVVEFPDYLAEGFVTLQAAETLDPFLAGTQVCVRLHATAELCNVLNGCYPRDRYSRALYAMERYCLHKAHQLIWPGGDVLESYRRFYGERGLAAVLRIRLPGADAAMAEAERGYAAGNPLRLLYSGRLERRKGVYNLIRAATALGRDDFRLTVVGADTASGPLGVSMREHLELAIAGDERIELRDPVAREDVAAMVRAHDVIVVPSLWECWPYSALDAIQRGRPLLGTPVGGLVEIIRPDVSGWLLDGTDVQSLWRGLHGVIDRRQDVEQVVRDGQPQHHAAGLCDHHEIVASYERLWRASGRATRPASAHPLGHSLEARTLSARPASPPPLVSAIVPYYHAARFVGATIDSLLRQSHPRMEIILVNDGSFDEEDRILEELAASAPLVVVSQINAGLGAARNLGVLRSSGRYFFPLDADNMAHPDFVARCVEVLERRPEVAYVTAWSQYVGVDGVPWDGWHRGYQPLGNHAALNDEQNVAGDAAAVIRRRLFDVGFRYSEDLASLEDWHYYRELQRADHRGAVIPERLLDYRVRDDSLQARVADPHRARLLDEIEAHLRENGTRWTASSA